MYKEFKAIGIHSEIANLRKGIELITLSALRLSKIGALVVARFFAIVWQVFFVKPEIEWEISPQKSEWLKEVPERPFFHHQEHPPNFWPFK